MSGSTPDLLSPQTPPSLWPMTGPESRLMSSDGATVKTWAVTPEKIAGAVSRMGAMASLERLIAFRSAVTGDLAAANELDLLAIHPQVADRYGEMVCIGHALRGLLMPIDLIETSQESYDDRSLVPGTVEFSERTRGWRAL